MTANPLTLSPDKPQSLRSPRRREVIEPVRPGSSPWEVPPIVVHRERYLRVRWLLDRLAAAMLLIVSAPLIAAAALAVRWTSPGPAFYSQIRLGRNGRLFRIHKLRTMVHNCESLTGPRWSLPGDPRITPLGRYLRLLHLDELPQLWNVVRGEMALIGPRPERPEIAQQLRPEIPQFDARLVVPPGITGYAQVQLPPDSEVAGVRHKLELDLAYIRTVSPWVDVRILFCTLLKMVGTPYPTLRRVMGATIREPVSRLPNDTPKPRGNRPYRKVA